MEGVPVEHLQQLGLHGEGELADFVEEEGPLVGQLKHAGLAALGRAGEGAFFVAEQFGFHKRHGDGPAVYRDERFGAALAHVVDGLGRQRLAGSGFAEDEGDGFGAGGLGGFLAQAAHGGAVSDEPGVHFGFEVLKARFVGEGFHLQIGELALERLQFGHVADGGDDPPYIALFVKNGRAGVQAALAVGIVVEHGDRAFFDERAQGDAGFEAPLVHGFGHVLADDFLGAQPGDAFHRLVDAQGDAVGVDDPDPVVDGVEQDRQLLPGQFGHPVDLIDRDFRHCDKTNLFPARGIVNGNAFPADNVHGTLFVVGDQLASVGFAQAFFHFIKSASCQAGQKRLVVHPSGRKFEYFS